MTSSPWHYSGSSHSATSPWLWTVGVIVIVCAPAITNLKAHKATAHKATDGYIYEGHGHQNLATRFRQHPIATQATQMSELPVILPESIEAVGPIRRAQVASGLERDIKRLTSDLEDYYAVREDLKHVREDIPHEISAMNVEIRATRDRLKYFRRLLKALKAADQVADQAADQAAEAISH